MISDKILNFYKSLSIPDHLPDNIRLMNPYEGDPVWELVRKFYTKYYNDGYSRKLILGINPGRFGGGITGVPFTDPINLENHCGIPNELDRRHELSSRFIYEVIAAAGGSANFYGKCFIGAVSPLGFIKDGKNINYYDNKVLLEQLKGFILKAIRDQWDICGNPPTIYCLGQGKNLKYLEQINKAHPFFEEIIPLPHPRWVLQYRMKQKARYIDEYLKVLM